MRLMYDTCVYEIDSIEYNDDTRELTFLGKMEQKVIHCNRATAESITIDAFVDGKVELDKYRYPK